MGPKKKCKQEGSGFSKHRDEHNTSKHGHGTESHMDDLRGRKLKNHKYKGKNKLHKSAIANDLDKGNLSSHKKSRNIVPRSRTATPPSGKMIQTKSRSGQCEKSSSSTESSTDDGAVFEIPGFYYDREKKKYFKIQPNHNNAASGTVTKQVINSQAVEKQRQSDLENFGKKHTKLPGKCMNHFNIQYKFSHSSNFHHIEISSQMGLRNTHSLRYQFRTNLIKRLAPMAVTKVIDDASYFSRLEDAKMMLLSSDSKKLIGVWSLSNLLGQCLHQINIQPAKKSGSDGGLGLNIVKNRTVKVSSEGCVTSLCWAPRSVDDFNTTRLLMTNVGFSVHCPNVAKVWDYEFPSACSYFDLGPKGLWTGSWNVHDNQFSVGTEVCSMVVEMATRSMWELYANKSPVYAQVFSPQTGQLLFSGNKKGQIFTHDLRSRSTMPVKTVAHQLSISCLYITQDENYLIASDVSGKIKKWDVRKYKVVHTYKGHVNRYIRRPFRVDPKEEFLFAAGEDCYSRIWCLRTGTLLHTLPPPHPVSIDSIPVLAYTESLGGSEGLPGLLMASKDELHFYSC